MRYRHLIASLTGLLFAFSSSSFSADPETAEALPRQVILIIGDGMDDQQITIARNYLKGAEGALVMDQLPLRAAVQVLTVTDTAERAPVYVADSANTATSMATGEVTSRGRIATSAGDDRDLETIVELAEAAGLRTGLVSTASITDATPAAFAAHVSLRLCENPEAMVDITYPQLPDLILGSCREDLKSAGGDGSIAEQLAGSGLDVLLGGGAKHFSPAVEGGGESVARSAQVQGFRLVRSREELLAALPGERLLGLFAPGTMPVRMQGEDGREAEAPQPSLMQRVHRYLGDVTLPDPMTCEANPAAEGLPSLREMTDVALAQLAEANDRGFFLMIESASIDKQSHERKACGAIGEVQQLDEALQSALDFATRHPRTLVLVTADHTHAAQLVPVGTLFDAYPIPIYTPGKLALLRTPEGAVMGINYATNNFNYEEHTGASVPLLGNAEAIDRVPAFLRQPDLFTIMREYLAL